MYKFEVNDQSIGADALCWHFWWVWSYLTCSCHEFDIAQGHSWKLRPCAVANRYICRLGQNLLRVVDHDPCLWSSHDNKNHMLVCLWEGVFDGRVSHSFDSYRAIQADKSDEHEEDNDEEEADETGDKIEQVDGAADGPSGTDTKKDNVKVPSFAMLWSSRWYLNLTGSHFRHSQNSQDLIKQRQETIGTYAESLNRAKMAPMHLRTACKHSMVFVHYYLLYLTWSRMQQTQASSLAKNTKTNSFSVEKWLLSRDMTGEETPFCCKLFSEAGQESLSPNSNWLDRLVFVIFWPIQHSKSILSSGWQEGGTDREWHCKSWRRTGEREAKEDCWWGPASSIPLLWQDRYVPCQILHFKDLMKLFSFCHFRLGDIFPQTEKQQQWQLQSYKPVKTIDCEAFEQRDVCSAHLAICLS